MTIHRKRIRRYTLKHVRLGFVINKIAVTVISRRAA